MNIKNMKIGVLMGGTSSEREVSLMSGQAVFSALQGDGFRVSSIDAGKDIVSKLGAEKIDIAFIALHGKQGEDGIIQGFLDVMGIPYTGSSVLASAIAMDKGISKELFEYHEMPTPSFKIVTREAFKQGEIDSLEAYPVVVKPANGGSTIGVTIINRPEERDAAIQEALKWDNRAIIEEYIQGPQVTVGVLGDMHLPVIEIAPKEGFYDYKAKYQSKETEYFLPPRIETDKQIECQALALNAHRKLRCSGATRTDFIIGTDGVPYILEINTIPGMTKTSLLPMAAKSAGLNFTELVQRILELALEERRVEKL